jgi:multidrug efflux pump subunit AcrB
MENVELPGGRIESLTKEYSVKVMGNIRDASEFNDLVIASYEGNPVRVRTSAGPRTASRNCAPTPSSTARPVWA